MSVCSFYLFLSLSICSFHLCNKNVMMICARAKQQSKTMDRTWINFALLVFLRKCFKKCHRKLLCFDSNFLVEEWKSLFLFLRNSGNAFTFIVVQQVSVKMFFNISLFISWTKRDIYSNFFERSIINFCKKKRIF